MNKVQVILYYADGQYWLRVCELTEEQKAELGPEAVKWAEGLIPVPDHYVAQMRAGMTQQGAIHAPAANTLPC